MRGPFASVLFGPTIVSASASAGEFVDIESGAKTAPIRLIGYTALAVDSFGPRGIDEQCSGAFPEQVADSGAAQLHGRPCR